jgi:hypothetical protein
VTESVDLTPGQVDIDTPSAARLYDYLLGGAYNFAADRALARKYLAGHPDARVLVRLNRDFLRRSVQFLLHAGIRQFLDVGSGLPTIGNVHEIAQRGAADARVVYVDQDATAVAHGRLILEDNRLATVVRADLTRPDDVFGESGTQALLDFRRPVGLLMVGVLQFVRPEQDLAGVLAGYRAGLAPGSWLVVSQLCGAPPRAAADIESTDDSMTNDRKPVHSRSVSEIADLFAGFDLAEPGVVPTPRWRPDSIPAERDDLHKSAMLAGVGRRR